MREIKFRAWDFKDREMHDVWRMGRLNGGWVMYNTGVGNCHYTGKDCAIMQYTGLKDENGVEIYEGDVIKYSRLKYKGSNGHLSKVKDLIHVGELSFNQEKGMFEFHYDFPTGGGYTSGGLEFDDDRFETFEIEVIGNIYENPELVNPNGHSTD